MNNLQKRFIDNVKSEFAEVKYPGDANLVTDFEKYKERKSDHYEVYNHFRGKHVEDFTNYEDFVDAEGYLQHNAFLYFTPKALHYYVQAFVIVDICEKRYDRFGFFVLNLETIMESVKVANEKYLPFIELLTFSQKGCLSEWYHCKDYYVYGIKPIVEEHFYLDDYWGQYLPDYCLSKTK